MNSTTGDHAYERGMILDIYKPSDGSASNGGVSARCAQVTVTRILDRTSPPGPHAMKPVPADCRVFEPRANRPEAVLMVQRLAAYTLLHVSPWTWTAEGPVGQAMMGGCYVAVPDNRWARCLEAELGTPFYGALALHDRWER